MARAGEAGPTPAAVSGLGGRGPVSATRAQGSAQMPFGSGGMRMEVDDVELIPIYSQLPEYPFLLPGLVV